MGDQQRFKQAVASIYGAHERNDRKSAEKWLEDWQRQSTAWQTADSILHDPGSSEDERYMAAQTLRTKTQRDFEELSGPAAGSLRDSLVKLLIMYGDGSKAVRTQLCVAIASLAVHLPAFEFGGSGVIGWLFSSLNSGSSAKVAVVCMLELLVTLPQEVNSHRVAVHPERRRQAVNEMKAMFPQALQTMEAALHHSGPSVMEQVLRSFAQWLHLTNAQGVACEELRSHMLVKEAFARLADPDVFETAVDAVDELVWCTVYFTDMNVPHIKSGMMPLIQEIVANVMALRPRFHVAVLRAANEAKGLDSDAGLDDAARRTPYDDDENVRGMVRLFLDVAEAYHAMVATGAPETIAPLEAVLEVASHPSLEVNTLSLGTFSKLASQVKEVRPDQEGRERLKLCYCQLVQLVSDRVKFPADYGSRSRESRTQFKRMRYEMDETIKDAVSVVGPCDVLRILVQRLQAAAGAAGAFDWRDAEAAYFCICALADDHPPHGDATLLNVLHSVTTCPAEPQLQYTACTLVRKYACWYAASALERPGLLDLVPALMAVVLRGFSTNLSAGGAGLAFSALCFNCAPTVAEQCTADVLATFQRAVQLETWARGGAHAAAMPLEEEDVASVIEGVASVLSTAHSRGQAEARGQIEQCLQLLLQPLSQLAQACKQKGYSHIPAADKDVHAAANCRLIRVSVFFQHLKCPDLVGGHMAQLWQFVTQFLELAGPDQHLVESSLKVIIKALGASQGNAADQWLPDVLRFIPAAYQETRFPGYLYLASHILRTCGAAASPHSGAVAAAVHAMITTACSRLTTLADCNAAPDGTDDLFLMAFKGLVHAPHVFLQQPVLAALLRTAVVGMLCQQQEAFKSIQAFLFRLLDVRTLEAAPDRQAMQAVLQELLMTYGPVLLRLLLAAVVGVLPENRIPDLASTLLQILLATSQAGLQWLQEATAAIPKHCATAADKDTFVRTLSQACSVDMRSVPQMDQSVWTVEQAMFELSAATRRNPRVRAQSEKALVPQELWPALEYT